MNSRSDLRTHTAGGRPLNLDAPRLHTSQFELLLRSTGLLPGAARPPAHRQRRADIVSQTAETSSKRRRWQR